MEENIKESKLNYLAGAWGILALVLFAVNLFFDSDAFTVIAFVSHVALMVGLFIRNDKLLLVSSLLKTVSTLIGMISYHSFNFNILTYIAVSVIFALVVLKKEIYKKLWVVPIILGIISSLVEEVMIIKTVSNIAASVLVAIVGFVIYTIPVILSVYWVTHKTYEVKDGSTKTISDGAINLILHIVLLWITCGIWYFIWIYRTTSFLNVVVEKDNRNPVAQLLLCIFVPFYYIYWIYESATIIDKLGAKEGINSDIKTICVILSIFVAFIPPIIMQSQINKIAMKE